jgi:hypothetical protein
MNKDFSTKTIFKHINYYICVTYRSKFELVADKKDSVTNREKTKKIILYLHTG